MAARLDGGIRRAREWGARGLVLVYHRVATGFDPLLLNVAPQRFAEHLDVVRAMGRPATLRDLFATGRRGEPAPIAITFDDGYSDNLRVARPLLEQAGVGATVFVTTGFVLEGVEPWWDEVVRLFADRCAGHATGCAWSVESSDDPSPDHARLRSMLAELRTSAPSERVRLLEQLRGEHGGAQAPCHPLLDAAGVSELSRSDAITIGAHTVTHPTLSALPAASQRDEILRSRADLAEIVGTAPDSFAYPFGSVGDYSRLTERLVRAAGFTFACANFSGRVGSRTRRYEIPRLVIRDWEAGELERRLSEALRGRR